MCSRNETMGFEIRLITPTKPHNNTMHRSPAGCVFTLTVAGQGPVIVDVIRENHGYMGRQPDTPNRRSSTRI